MAFDRSFAVGLALRLVLLIGALGAAAAAFVTPGLVVARLVALALAGGAIWSLWHHVQRTNVEIARFVEAVRFADLSASFARPGAGAGFDALGAALDAGIRALREERARLSDESRFYQAIVDDLPVALLLVDPEGRIEPVGKVARRMFAGAPGVRAADYRGFGESFVAALETLAPGRRQLVLLETGGTPQRAMLRAAAVHRLGGAHRVISVQPIQDALNAVEVATQSDLIRVLTHEIMNSMTPVTSLARTAADLMARAEPGDAAAIADARAAVETLARRADGVMYFVESYRQISRTPQIRRRRFAAAPFAAELARLFAADHPPERIALGLDVTPAALSVDADPDLLAQVLINLLRNAADACEGHAAAPQVLLRIVPGPAGGTLIEVEDNGPGVPDAQAREIFLPFYTTKPKGTGVGLSLARQVVLGHDGAISVGRGALGGALFRILV